LGKSDAGGTRKTGAELSLAPSPWNKKAYWAIVDPRNYGDQATVDDSDGPSRDSSGGHKPRFRSQKHVKSFSKFVFHQRKKDTRRGKKPPRSHCHPSSLTPEKKRRATSPAQRGKKAEEKGSQARPKLGANGKTTRKRGLWDENRKEAEASLGRQQNNQQAQLDPGNPGAGSVHDGYGGCPNQHPKIAPPSISRCN